MSGRGCSIYRALDKGKSARWEQVFWPGLVISLALAFAFVTGPFRAPDEPHHFFRAYEISEGRMVAARPGGGFVGDWLPHSLDKTVRALGGYPYLPPVGIEPGAWEKAWQIQFKSRRTFIPFPGAALHSPLVYLPAVLGISLGKICHARPLLLLYLARAGNAIMAGGLLGLALSRIWRRAPYLVTIALFPMSLFQVGALTSDALTFALSFLWLAEVLRARGENPPGPTRWRWILFALALSQLRFPYPMLGLLVFALPRNSLGENGAARGRFLALFFAGLILPCLLWISVVQGLRAQWRPAVVVDPGGQLLYVLGHPLHFFGLLGATLRENGYEFWRQAIGVFGWLNLPLPTWILLGVTLCLVITACSSDPPALALTGPLRIACFALAAAGFLLTAIMIYLAWNRVGAPRIEGWQGRYAIPLLPVLATACSNSVLRRFRSLGHGALAFAILANLAAIVYLARATWL